MTTLPSSINRKKHASARYCTNPKASKHSVRCACHCLDACFKPCKLLFSLTTIFHTLYDYDSWY